MLFNYIIMKYRRVQFEQFPKSSGRIRIYGGKHQIIMGSGVRINSSVRANPIGGMDSTLLAIKSSEASIIIGNNVGISNSALVAANRIVIEDDVMIGGSCKIYDTDFHSLEYDYRLERPDSHVKSKPIRIKKGAFIGAHSIILKGVTVGEKSIVGAGSVVTHDIPDGEIWGGNPAVYIRKIL